MLQECEIDCDKVLNVDNDSEPGFDVYFMILVLTREVIKILLSGVFFVATSDTQRHLLRHMST